MFALTITQSRVRTMYKHCIRFSHVSSYLCNVVWITLVITCLENHASPGYWGGVLCVSGKSLYPGTLLYCRGMRHACQICCTIWCHHRRAILKCACILSMCDRCLFCVWFDPESLAVQKRPYISCPVIFVGTAVCTFVLYCPWNTDWSICYVSCGQPSMQDRWLHNVLC